MKQKELFLQADAALRSVIDRITPEQLSLPAPAEWSSTPDPTLRDVLAAHARDEAWVPDVLLGRTIEDAGGTYDGDLLGADPIAAYDRLNDLATRAVSEDLDPEKIVHLSYGDFPLREYLEHVSIYRAFQAWSIARQLGWDYSLPAPLVETLWEVIGPQVEGFRAMGVFPPEVEVPSDADRETQLLGRVGYWVPKP
ncbi:hypothetical protein [Cryobacterium arcticum]|uniref:TIGR03086 family protein n=1 Tax=Cryobacterium arcticum TaxID=670052 RepID=A0A1B1BGM5_9MICO|nr:hypothetical protein [Cryobacterium arcticum]ANP71727.1 hypothetical protein PA27867_0760 [Cryobacterium arcticum]